MVNRSLKEFKNNMVDTNERNLIQLLDWYQHMGVNWSVADEHLNWLDAEFDVSSFQFDNSPSQPAVKAQNKEISALTAFQDGAELAYSANTLSELKTQVEKFEGCSLKTTAHTTCFADGNPEADLMIIGEAPGRDEDRAGIPFVGQAGQLLNQMLLSIGFERAQHVYVTNTVFWRPLGNRAPNTQETTACKPFLDRQIELVKPKVIFVLGNSATKTLLNTTQGIMRMRGKWHKIQLGEKEFDVLPSLHPAYLLRTPLAKRLVYRDLLALKEKMKI